MNVSAYMIRAEVDNVLIAIEGSYDVDAIVAELIEKYDVTGESPKDTIDSLGDRFWDCAIRHAKDQT
jgi:hypothetical protein